ncbi:ADP-dependent glucokinase/phosphofructokinase [Brachybacterium sp. p3-SID957]|uniref:ADP-dependent glucokinase/phosphofructokinase n=1 Tax=Brachybacterium sp. p3-SID957 TaxID=2916049 RepID=UPI00223B8B4A|nr:ADP-dependent glucokinase/phosphofructokinase [Brachybacterium sp. p3-SID957]MCT1775113.1 ADP-dependent glucokinase/phosphofructokinase [Brachybacterium sp. p3-SID957]
MTTSIVLGLGGCLDSELVLDPDVLQDLIDHQDLGTAEITQPDRITTERELLISVLAYLRDGVGGERYIESTRALLAFETRFSRELALGGTNVRAGRVLAKLGHDNILHVPGRDPEFESLLVDGSEVPPTTPPATYVPHLIVQYPRGLRLRLRDGAIESPHPNRLIFVNDPVSELTPLHPQLEDWLGEDGVLTLSGLNSIRDEQILEERLTTLKGVLDSAPTGLRVLYEDADYHVPAFRRRVWAELAVRASVVGMNEDELASFTGRPVDITDPGQIASALHAVLDELPGGTVIVHSKYWALAAGLQAAELEQALEVGIAAAGARFVHGDSADSSSLERVREMPESTEGVDLAAELPAFLRCPVVIVPARELTSAHPTTIGLGDTFLGGLIAGIVDTGAVLDSTEMEHS